MKNKQLLPLILGLVILTAFVLMALFPALFSSYGRKEMFDAWIPPCSEHILGTNSLGYDIFTELVYGSGQTLFVALSSGFLSIILGTLIGILAAGKGFCGRFFSGLISIFIMLPSMICLIVFACFIGSSNLNRIFLISAFIWSGTARNVKAKVEDIKVKNFILNLRLQGFGRVHIALHHILPNLFDVILTRFLLEANTCIMMESSLSFLGIGDIYYPTWGTMVNLAFNKGAFVRRAYAYLLSPGICIVLLSLAFYFIGTYFEHRRESI